MKHYRLAALAAVVGLLSVLVAACGGSSSSSSGGGPSTNTTTSTTAAVALKPGMDGLNQNLTGGKRGGTLAVYSNSDFSHLDPGQAYYVLDYSVIYVTERTLFIYPPNTSTTLAPNLATAVPTVANGGISADGKTVTVHIQPNVKFSPPVNRVVTSADVKYAIERGFNSNVPSGYSGPYFGDLVGAPTAPKPTTPSISGITTPNATTIVFKLTKPTSNVLIGALSMPLTAPVPASVAGPLDKHAPTTYGTQAVSETGPYMIKQDSSGKFAGIGYQVGKSLTLVRNPNWDPNTYTSAYKPPAYLDQINVVIGGDSTVIGQKVLHGSDSVQLDTPTQAVVKLAYQQFPNQLKVIAGAGTHYGGLDTTSPPFNNVNVRRAVWALIDRNAIVRAKGGTLVASPMTHFLTPGTDGFTQAGGLAGPNYPWNKNPNGDLALAHQLMKQAGYPSGNYTGSKVLQVVGGSGGNSPAVVAIITSELAQLGFKTHVSLVDQGAMYSKYCGVPKAHINVCPTSGWVRDFNNPLTILLAPFDGKFIIPTGNVNWSNLNDPAINAAMDAASKIIDPTAAAAAWGKIDAQLVNLAVGLPEEFDSQPNIESANVNGINDLWNTGGWDFAYTSLK